MKGLSTFINQIPAVPLIGFNPTISISLRKFIDWTYGMVPNRELQPASGTTVWEAQRVGRPAQSIIEDTAKWALIQCQVRYMVQDVCHEQFESIESLLLLLLLFWDSDRSKSHSCKIRSIFSSFFGGGLIKQTQLKVHKKQAWTRQGWYPQHFVDMKFWADLDGLL